MKVTSSMSVPSNAPIKVTIEGTLSEFLALKGELESTNKWSKLGELLTAAIRNSSDTLRQQIETVIEQTPDNT